MNEIEKSYLLQAKSELNMSLSSRYNDPYSIDNWRHTRMLELTRPLWEEFPNSEWLTVGDGCYGSDAAYLHSNGVNVIATSLNDDKLKYAHSMGYIPAYKLQNAENITLPNDAVDFVLCKEAYHHFPRPPLALYEMIRIARVGVILIEPLDNIKFLDGIKTLLKRALRGDQEMLFEPSGNFIYRLNIKELEKLITAMGFTDMAYKGINDFFHSKFSKCDSRKINFGSVLTRFGILVQNLLSWIGLLSYGLCVVVIMKKQIDYKILNKAGYKIIKLPHNPYR